MLKTDVRAEIESSIEQHDATITQVLVVLLVKFASAVCKHQRGTRLQAPCCFISIAVASGLRIQPFG
ncbi:hypothetical protein A5906_35305 [Bradyrhizobium sacchari]|nr:hypothetical protein A5906_35305 [Bradyrhizobium sacchari]